MNITNEDMCYWDVLRKELKGSQIQKAKQFNKHKCVKRITDNYFKIEPIEGYNKTTYHVTKKFDWECDCQFADKSNNICSHILAVLLFLKMQYDSEHPENYMEED